MADGATCLIMITCRSVIYIYWYTVTSGCCDYDLL